MKCSEETRRKISEAVRKKWSDPVYRETTVASFKRSRALPEVRQHMSEGHKYKINEEAVINLYGIGMTLDEVAVALGLTQKLVLNCLKRNNIPRRSHAVRNQWGDRNSSWKGDQASYKGFHSRLCRTTKNVNQCSMCGTLNPKRWYEWANLTGKYNDPGDYVRMCRSCHHKFDNAVRNFYGRKKNWRKLNGLEE